MRLRKLSTILFVCWFMFSAADAFAQAAPQKTFGEEERARKLQEEEEALSAK